MKALNFLSNKRTAKAVAALSLAFGLTLTAGTLGLSTASARIGAQPVDVDPKAPINPGSALAVGVQLTGASNITIYSSPLGAVSYSGYANATDTVYAATSASDTGTVTVYLETDGTTIVNKQVVCAPGP
jgi:hypothetical protein